MENFWQICEVEDNTHSFTEYTVAALPEIWIVQLEDGSFICYWPKVNPRKKIREFCHPNEGGKWVTYKCRLLMNEEKFSSYEEARKAEKIAENESMILDSSEIMDAETDCNSTMDFDVSNDDEGEMNMIVGNDTVEFNRANVFGGRYCSKKIKFVVKNTSDPNSTDGSDINSQNDQNYELLKTRDGYSDGSDYSGHFKSNNDFLTSTLLEEPTSLKIADNQKVLAKIELIEANLSSFDKNMTKELCELKQLFSCPENSNNEFQNAEKLFGQSGETNVNSTALRLNNLTFDVGDLYPRCRDGINQSEERRTAPSNVSPSSQIDILNVEILNEPVLKVQVSSNTEVLSDAEVYKETQKDIPLKVFMPTPNVVPNDEATLEKSVEMLKFPVSSVVAYHRNEDLLYEQEEVMEKALVEHLLPLENEDDVKYMNRTILTVFNEKFFVKSVTFRREKDPERLYVKGTNTLKCWRESYNTKFSQDEKKDKFIGHIRRFKNSKRAAKKAEEKAIAKRMKKLLKK